jgi:hypothetical protein
MGPKPRSPDGSALQRHGELAVLTGPWAIWTSPTETHRRTAYGVLALVEVARIKLATAHRQSPCDAPRRAVHPRSE